MTPDMLEAGKKRRPKPPSWLGNSTGSPGDAMALPFADAAFDRVTQFAFGNTQRHGHSGVTERSVSRAAARRADDGPGV
jgi:hypothetical protein